MAILYHIFASLSSFQLHTFNSTRYIRNRLTNQRPELPLFLAFNSTRYIRNNRSQSVSFDAHYSFNSTRCIRNQPWHYIFATHLVLSTPHGALGTRRILSQLQNVVLLSTPHGALGTSYTHALCIMCITTFNSTRCIRNGIAMIKQLSIEEPFNSTRCIRNIHWLDTGRWRLYNFQLHTVHQERKSRRQN